MRRYFIYFLAIAMFSLASCGGDDQDFEETTQEHQEDTDESREGGEASGLLLENDCFSILFPISYLMPDGAVLISNDREELEKGIEDWYEINGESDVRPSVIYPFEGTFRGESLTVQSEETLQRIREACYGGEDNDTDRECFTFIYPISYTMPDGNILTADSPEALERGFQAWYDNNNTSDVRPALIYPVNVVFNDQRLTVDSDEELTRIINACEESNDDDDNDDDRDEYDRDCYEFIYPIGYTMPDGSTFTGQEAELERYIRNWYDNNESDVRPLLIYPVNIVWGDRRITIDSEEELARLEDACRDDDDDDDDDDREECLELIYPISFTMPDGSIVSGSSDEELAMNLENWYIINGESDVRPQLIYPIDIIFDDRNFTVNNEDELARFREACSNEDDDDDDREEYDCPELRADIGDPCRDGSGNVGTINERCECAL